MTNPTHEEMLEEASKRETENRVTAAERYFKKVEESLQRRSIQSVIEEIGQYSDIISKTKGSKLISKLKNRHRENLTSVSEIYMQEYVNVYGEMPEYENRMFMESSYFIPSEGHTTCLLVTQALPCIEDYDDNNFSVTTRAHRAVREFYEEFGSSSLYNLAFHSSEVFFEQYSAMIPYTLTKLKDKPCMLMFKTKLHYHFP